MKILISAGEASGDLYASALVAALRSRIRDLDFFGCAGPRLAQAGVRAVVDAHSLNVVGLVEVVRHIPRIHGEFRKLLAAAEREKPDLAILTDSPDFHLRLAPKLKAMGIPVVYLIAPQVWAWRKGRLPRMRKCLDHLLCIFPFEEQFFRNAGIPATYIGHPLTRIVKPSMTGEAFRAKHNLPPDLPIVTLLPGSRPGEIARHLPILVETVKRIRQPTSFLLATPKQLTILTEPLRGTAIQHLEGETWDAIAHADLALAASGTVTIEAAILGTPMVAFYKVSPWSWWMGRYLVNVPFFTMVNLVAERRIVPELIQTQLSPGSLASEAVRLLTDRDARLEQQMGLQQLTRTLASDRDPMDHAAEIVLGILGKEHVHAGH
jgi:lipid-A-disaccharide synthase